MSHSTLEADRQHLSRRNDLLHSYYTERSGWKPPITGRWSESLTEVCILTIPGQSIASWK